MWSGLEAASRRRLAGASSRALTVGEREEISRGLATGVSFRQLGVQLGRPTSTVSREVGRHGGRQRVSRAWRTPPRGTRRAGLNVVDSLSVLGLCACVAEKLAADWSPQQIAGWLQRTYPQGPGHAGLARDDLPESVRAEPRRAEARAPAPPPAAQDDASLPAATTAGQQPRGHIVGCRCRSASGRRASRTGPCPVTGKGDLLAGKANSHIATLVERQSRFVMLVRSAWQGHAKRRTGAHASRPHPPDRG